ncbi:hypothetical protein [Microbacterium karelineae]|uniref:hypothetical protein n=1 Tax=Microbacterium karelineae TaxID=2654283 RepID=UPI0012EAFF8F|nr:hypothetical protein [Microbacterium karelineae]
MNTFLDDESLVHLPLATDADRDEVVERLFDMWSATASEAVAPDEGDSGGPMGHVESLAYIVPFLESLLDDPPDELPLAACAQIVHMVEYPAVPEIVVIQTAFGRRAGEEMVRHLERLFARARQRNLSVDEYIADAADTGRIAHDRTARMFRGEVRRAPDDERMRTAIRILRRAASLVPPELRSHLLCAIGWLQWARGRRPVALAYLAEAERTDSGCPFPLAITELVSARRPRWCA